MSCAFEWTRADGDDDDVDASERIRQNSAAPNVSIIHVSILGERRRVCATRRRTVVKWYEEEEKKIDKSASWLHANEINAYSYGVYIHLDHVAMVTLTSHVILEFTHSTFNSQWGNDDVPPQFNCR